MLAGSLMTRWGVRLSPFITARCGAPFNITTGQDNNGDTEFNDRPAYATRRPRPGRSRRSGDGSSIPLSGAPLIPRNYGQSPGYFAVNLRVSKVFGFGEARSAPTPGFGAAVPAVRAEAARRPRNGPPRWNARHLFGPADGPSLQPHPQRLGAQSAEHHNPGPVVGNLSSEFFGQSLSLANAFGPVSGAGNRRLEMGLRFSF